jgi:invasion protein IalB
MGCVAQIGLTQGDIDAFKKGQKAVLSLRPAPAPDQVVEMDLSLKGFTAGYNVVDVVKQ